MFAAVNFSIWPPGLLHISTSLLNHIICIEPALEVPTAKFALLILFVTSALPFLLNLDLVFGKLWRALR